MCISIVIDGGPSKRRIENSFKDQETIRKWLEERIRREAEAEKLKKEGKKPKVYKKTEADEQAISLLADPDEQRKIFFSTDSGEITGVVTTIHQNYDAWILTFKVTQIQQEKAKSELIWEVHYDYRSRKGMIFCNRR